MVIFYIVLFILLVFFYTFIGAYLWIKRSEIDIEIHDYFKRNHKFLYQKYFFEEEGFFRGFFLSYCSNLSIKDIFYIYFVKNCFDDDVLIKIMRKRIKIFIYSFVTLLSVFLVMYIFHMIRSM